MQYLNDENLRSKEVVKNKIQSRGKQNLRGLPLKGEVAVAGEKKKNIYIYIYDGHFREQISKRS